MKRLAGIFILITFLKPTSAQDFNGIYRGDLFSKDNVISLRVKKGTASGVLFTSVNDKYSFQPVITGRELTGTLNYSSVIWTMKGTLFGDSLSVMMASGQETRQALLLRIYSDPKKNVPDIIESFSRDQRLIGTWRHIKTENSDGSLKQLPEGMVGLTQRFEPGGALYYEFPNNSIKVDGKTIKVGPPQPIKWNTQGSKLNRTSSQGTGSVDYEIRHDTLIVVEKNGKAFFLRRK